MSLPASMGHRYRATYWRGFRVGQSGAPRRSPYEGGGAEGYRRAWLLGFQDGAAERSRGLSPLGPLGPLSTEELDAADALWHGIAGDANSEQLVTALKRLLGEVRGRRSMERQLEGIVKEPRPFCIELSTHSMAQGERLCARYAIALEKRFARLLGLAEALASAVERNGEHCSKCTKTRCACGLDEALLKVAMFQAEYPMTNARLAVASTESGA